MRRLFFSLLLFSLSAASALAQDPVQVDPDHYQVVLENDQVRVLRITYGPQEKSVMHDHPSGVVVYLTDQHARFSTPDGKRQEVHGKAGEAAWHPGGKHLPENISDKPLEAILVEIKPKAEKAHAH